MYTSALCLVCLSLLFGTSLSCYTCFMEHLESLRLCWGYYVTSENVVNLDRCFRMLDRIFNHNQKVLRAGRVAEGYDGRLREILRAEVIPIMNDFDRRTTDDTVYKERLQRAADNFIVAASQLPRVSACVPPCGAFQSAGGVYNCHACRYDSCQFPLDCPIREITVLENSRSEMLCEVPYRLPSRIEVIWRFAATLRTQQVQHFEEVTAGLDKVFSISSTTRYHHGTYQCEIYTGQSSIIRIYYYLTVIPQDVVGHTQLQEIFDLSMLPGGRLHSAPVSPPSSILQPPPPPLLLAACLTALLLLLILSLGVLYWSLTQEQGSQLEPAVGLEEFECRELGRYM